MGFEPQTYSPEPDLLADRIILVTGAGSGIGRAAALSYAGHGARVILHGRTVSKLEQVYDEIVAAGGRRPSIAPLNLLKAQADAFYQLRDSIEDEFGQLDGLLHNAGILGERTPIEQYDINTWVEVIHVNLTVPFVLTQVLLPLLNKSGDASVVFTSSGVGRQGRAYWGAYAVSKFGTEGLAQVLADETAGAGRIRVNCVNPGRTRTAMRAAAYPAEDPNTLPQPEDIMAAYLYLMGPDSRGVTGQSLDARA
ncbi:MAG: YciK family oxidoreductase [Gammaproteobacteria bacterium]|nr:YciK family oxidoreductase [Gammaproteobacteria bacterium]